MAIEAQKRVNLLESTFRQICEDLEKSGFEVGTKIQPIRNLAARYKVSYLTAQRAVKLLQKCGVLEARPGDGIYVAGQTGDIKEANFQDILARMPQTHVSSEKERDTEKKTRSIGVVMPFWASDSGSSVIYKMVKGLLARTDTRNWSVEMIHNTGMESVRPGFIDKILKKGFDGVVWLQPVNTHMMNLMRLADRGVPVVATGRRFEEVPIPTVHMDNDDLARKCVDYLLGRGCRDLAMLTGPIEGVFADCYSMDIVAAVKKAMSERGLELSPERICQAYPSPHASSILQCFFGKNKSIDGVICLHYNLLIKMESTEHVIFEGYGARLPLVDVTAIFESGLRPLKHVEVIKVAWPLENIGRAAVMEFEKMWLNESVTEKPDLSVDIIENQ